jgi:5-methyltetrahydrofolate--homocysteine methyltransferase
MGTELQKRGLKPGQPSELFNFTAPEKVAEVIRAYAEAGADIVSANTFCANRHKLAVIGKSVDETVSRAIEIAKTAVDGLVTSAEGGYKPKNTLIALDVGSIGQLLRPTGTLTFEEAYDIFAEVVRAGVKAGADLVVLQTFSDLLELKCAILAVKENSRLGVISSMTFESKGRTFTGCPVSAYALTAAGLGVDVIGVNCSLGPKEIKGIVKELIQWTDLPVMVKPNAGLPDPITGKFGMNASDFAAEMREITQYAKVIGGCCGTSPEYIKQLTAAHTETINNDKKRFDYAVCSGVKTVVLDRVRVIGERINPTGKRMFKEALKSSDTDYVLGQAIEQTHAGADILDVNVGLPEINEKKMMLKVIESLQGVCDLPLQIDSGDPEVIEAALRHYNGKPIVNSVNGKEESLSAILPLVKKYGAMVIGLTLDENGIAQTPEQRLKIARKIMNRALEIGVKKENLIIDCLTLTVSTDSNAARTTLDTVKLIKNTLGLKTALGISNVSFGLPNRDLINCSFLTSALNSGLDLPIINPNSISVMGAVRAFRLLNNQDVNAKEFIAAYSDTEVKQTVDSQLTIVSCIESGLKKDAATITARLLETTHAMTIVNQHLIPALDKVGTDFENGKIFLPQLIFSAETAGVCFDVIKSKMNSSFTGGEGEPGETDRTIILATVKGDIHDIGKNIVKVLLENYGYHIIDLGKDVSPEIIADSAAEYGAKLVGLSALMTTTLPAMQQTIEMIRGRGLACKIMVGGAILTADYAAVIGADYYAKDAKGAVDVAKKLFTNKNK